VSTAVASVFAVRARAIDELARIRRQIEDSNEYFHAREHASGLFAQVLGLDSIGPRNEPDPDSGCSE
jgi:hypothetical protein